MPAPPRRLPLAALAFGAATAVAVSAAGVLTLPQHAGVQQGRSAAASRPATVPIAGRVTALSLGDRSRRAPSPDRCERIFGARCYGAGAYATVYGARPLWRKGIDGRHETIAIVDSFGSPTIHHDLRQFDHAFHLPNPALRVVRPVGRIPSYDAHRNSRVGWALETTLDVDFAHTLAPGAKILLIETPINETEGVTGLPQMMRAESWAIRHHLADVISQSFGATEQTFRHRSSIRHLRSTFKRAHADHVTVLAAAGDDGATDHKTHHGLYGHRVQSWPSADPLVTSVGGLSLNLTAGGRRRAPDHVWNDGSGAGGGGRSVVFGRPSWQQPVRGRVGNARGVPDLSMSADVNGGGLVWTSFGGESKGWQLVGGTSMSTPLFAGVVALADQAAGHDLGLINPALYAIGAQGAKARAQDGLIDITRGNNSHHGVRGWRARRGFDLASGWGTVDASAFVPALVAEASSSP